MNIDTAHQCDLNPVKDGLYEWGDLLNTKVEIRTDGSAIIYQGDQRIVVDSFGFFKDVQRVFRSAIDSMPEGELRTTLLWTTLGTSRSLPDADWD